MPPTLFALYVIFQMGFEKCFFLQAGFGVKSSCLCLHHHAWQIHVSINLKSV
jgi:hypothetical protein